MKYEDFIKKKEIRYDGCGFEPDTLNKHLFDWQSDIVRWCLMKGRAAIFADCGLGKTAMQLQWSDEVARHTGRPVLIAAPLAVGRQTVREGEKFGVKVHLCRTSKDVTNGVNVTNYEILEHFHGADFGGVVLDESSILKNAAGHTRKVVTEMFAATPFKLCCTATPSPNDYMELGTHAEFLGVMKQVEMLATFFCHDGGNTSKWRLKGHAVDRFFEWVASWACCLTTPGDLGYSDAGYVLPALRTHEVVVQATDLENADGQLMLCAAATQTLNERRAARRKSLAERVKKADEIANTTEEQVLVWCDLNDESRMLAEEIRGGVEVTGSQPAAEKEQAMMAFTDGSARALISKPSIAGWGMNWQQCSRIIFVGLSDSFEAYYQAVRRCWRFGQKNPVDVYIVISDAEGCVKNNIDRKQQDAQRMTHEITKHTRETLKAEIHNTTRMVESYVTAERMEVPVWIA